MQDIINIINNNPNIEFDIKPKVIECVTLILNNYPISYKNLYKNLKDININYINENNKYRLESINALSIYDSSNNEMILNKQIMHESHYKNLLLHELLHVASFNKKELGLENRVSGTGLSLNEGVTELLTRRILNSFDFGIAIYENDINNVCMFSHIIGEDNMIKAYFDSSLQNILELYLNKIGPNNNLREILTNMNMDYIERVIKNNINNPYKDEYIKYLIDDISKINCNSNEEVVAKISLINSYIRGQYNSLEVPKNIKLSIENSLNTILNNYEYEKGKYL